MALILSAHEITEAVTILNYYKLLIILKYIYNIYTQPCGDIVIGNFLECLIYKRYELPLPILKNVADAVFIK